MSAPGGGPYAPRLMSRTRATLVRGVSYRLREWGPVDAPLLVLLHGARDTSASFQFVVDGLRRSWRVVAPDWRGHGGSGWTPGSYWQGEFLSDLHVLLGALSPDRPVRLVGHSMGGNLASLYAGLRPDRVVALVLLDALGELLNRVPVDAGGLLAAVLAAQDGGLPDPFYPTRDDIVARLRRANPRLSSGAARFLARETERRSAEGGFGWPYDPAFRRSLPNLHRAEDWAAVWRGITAPVLCLSSTDPRPAAPLSHPDVVRERSAHFRSIRVQPVPETGHNLHHDAPHAVAGAIEDFMARGTA